MDLLSKLKNAREKAIASHSNFKVGAVLVCDDGTEFDGANIENSSFGLTICAERLAIFKALNAGFSQFSHIAVIGDTEQPITPCGACRQIMVEFMPAHSRVLLYNLKGDLQECTVEQLMPYSFNIKRFNHTRNER